MEVRKLQPEIDEIEISLFGPGYGECVLIHPGDGHWIIVDSCVDPRTLKPAALSYFSNIGVDTTVAVKRVIATHWHDDHVRGLGEVFRVCKSAEFVCSAAMGGEEFTDVVEVYGYGRRIMTESPSGVDEFRKVLDELALRAKESGQKKAPLLAIENRSLYSEYINAAGVLSSIDAISPSDLAVISSQLDIAKLIPNPKETKRSLLPFSANRAAVVLWVSIGELHALLGADLEENGVSGWTRIVDPSTQIKAIRGIGPLRFPRGSIIRNSPLRVQYQNKASVFKVPHHGSKNAHHPRVWSDLLEGSSIAVLTPYRLGWNTLPKKEDIDRICSLTDSAYTTAETQRDKAIKRDRVVEKMIREMGRPIRQCYTSPGHIRLRARQGFSWQVDLFDGAIPLCESKVA